MFRLSSQNLRHGGVQAHTGAPDDRWPEIADVIRSENPDVLCLQELHGWRDHNYQQLFRAEKDLGMRVAGWVAGGRSIGGTLVMYRPGPLVLTQWENKDDRELYNGLTVPVFDLGGPVGLAVASVHFVPWSASRAADEALTTAVRIYRYGGLGILAGDVNHHPLDDYALLEAARALNVAGRWRHTNKTLVPDRTVAQKLTSAELTDVAAHLAETFGDPSLCAPTASGEIRIDQAWVTPGLVPALVGYRRTFHDSSDHAMITVDIDPDAIAYDSIKAAS